MDANTLKAIERLCDLADNLDTNANYIGCASVIEVISDTMARADLRPPQPQQRTGAEVI